jgi:hypothetical protein
LHTSLNNTFKKMNEQQQVERSLIKPGNNIESINCVIRGVYQLSFNHYLRQNGFSLRDLDQSSQMAQFRRLSAWPSASKFVFSLAQMRDAYQQLAESELSTRFMTAQQIAQAKGRRKPREEFWSVLGEAPTAEQSFYALENDQKTPRDELRRLRLQAHAFRIVLFQQKISQFKETGNFLFLLHSASRELAREVFQNCLGILPVSPALLESQESGEEGEEEEIIRGGDVGPDVGPSPVTNVAAPCINVNSLRNILAALRKTKLQVSDLLQQVKTASEDQARFCAEFYDSSVQETTTPTTIHEEAATSLLPI